MNAHASASASSPSSGARMLRSGRAVRAPAAQLEFEDRLFRVLGLVGGLGFWEAWRLPMVCRELRFGFSGGGAPADMIKLGLEKRGVWAKLREARAARRDNVGKSALLAAVEFGARDAAGAQRVSALIELGRPGSVDARESLAGFTPLIWASLRGHEAAAAQLLAAGASAGRADAHGWAPLHYASRWGHEGVARRLVAAGADVRARSARGETALGCARAHGWAAIAAALERAGADD